MNKSLSEDLRLLAVHAHPDDESSKAAATLAYYRDRGARVMVATATGGERGDILNPLMSPLPVSRRDLAALRREEMAKARQAVSFEHRWLGFVDSGLPETNKMGGASAELPWGSFASLPLPQTAEPLIRLVREFRPHVIITYDENGGYPHPDHIRTHQITYEAYEKAGDPANYPEVGKPWQPLKLYYDITFIPERFEALDRALESKGKPPVFREWVAGWRTEVGGSSVLRRSLKDVTTRIPAADFFAVRDQALLSHTSQIDPEGLFFAVPQQLQAEYWPTEDFMLAHSRVETTFPEDDLFAGINTK